MRLSGTLSAYIGRQFLVWFATFFAGLSVVILIADLLELLRRASSKPDASLGLVLQMGFLKLPHTVQELLPFAILFGGIMAFWRLTRSNELVVARAVGVSVWQFMLPAIATAVVIGLFKISVFNPLAASMLARYEVIEAKVLRGQVSQLAIAPSGLWLRQTAGDGHAILHASRVSTDLRTLDTVLVLVYDDANRFSGRIDARRATLQDGYWALEEASYAPSGQPSRDVGSYRLPTEFTLEKIQDSFARPETMSFWTLPAFIDLLERAGFSAIRHRLYWQSLLAGPLLLSAMVVIAATFSLRPARRGGVGTMIGLGVATGFLLYFLSDLVYALGLSARIPVPLAAWAPAVVSTLLGLAMLLHQEDG